MLLDVHWGHPEGVDNWGGREGVREGEGGGRKGEREGGREGGREGVCVCVCVRERERERELLASPQKCQNATHTCSNILTIHYTMLDQQYKLPSKQRTTLPVFPAQQGI